MEGAQIVSAREAASGTEVTIETACLIEGERPAYVCLECGKELIAKDYRSSQRSSHFAHRIAGTTCLGRSGHGVSREMDAQDQQEPPKAWAATVPLASDPPVSDSVATTQQPSASPTPGRYPGLEEWLLDPIDSERDTQPPSPSLTPRSPPRLHQTDLFAPPPKPASQTSPLTGGPEHGPQRSNSALAWVCHVDVYFSDGRCHQLRMTFRWREDHKGGGLCVSTRPDSSDPFCLDGTTLREWNGTSNKRDWIQAIVRGLQPLKSGGAADLALHAPGFEHYDAGQLPHVTFPRPLRTDRRWIIV